MFKMLLAAERLWCGKKAVENQNDDFNIKMNVIPVKMVWMWNAVTLRRLMQKHLIEADKRSESFLLE